MNEIVSEQVSVRLSSAQKAQLDEYQSKRPGLSRAGCFVQMLHDISTMEKADAQRLRQIEDTLIEHGAMLKLLLGDRK
jgi:hypothetical protein